MSFWDLTDVPKQQHKFFISFGKVEDPNKYAASDTSIAPEYIKSVELPSYDIGNIQLKYLYSHTYNFPKRLTWKPITITIIDFKVDSLSIRNELDRLKEIAQKHGTIGLAREALSFETDKKSVPLFSEKYFKDGSPTKDAQTKTFSKSTQIILYKFLQNSGYFSPLEDLETQDAGYLLRLRSYNFKDNMVYNFSKQDDSFDILTGKNDTPPYFSIHQISHTGFVNETWRIYNPLIISVKADKLDYSSTDLLTYTLTIAYDWARLVPGQDETEATITKARETAKASDTTNAKNKTACEEKIKNTPGFAWNSVTNKCDKLESWKCPPTNSALKEHTFTDRATNGCKPQEKCKDYQKEDGGGGCEDPKCKKFINTAGVCVDSCSLIDEKIVNNRCVKKTKAEIACTLADGVKDIPLTNGRCIIKLTKSCGSGDGWEKYDEITDNGTVITEKCKCPQPAVQFGDGCNKPLPPNAICGEEGAGTVNADGKTCTCNTGYYNNPAQPKRCLKKKVCNSDEEYPLTGENTYDFSKCKCKDSNKRNIGGVCKEFEKQKCDIQFSIPDANGLCACQVGYKEVKDGARLVRCEPVEGKDGCPPAQYRVSPGQPCQCIDTSLEAIGPNCYPKCRGAAKRVEGSNDCVCLPGDGELTKQDDGSYTCVKVEEPRPPKAAKEGSGEGSGRDSGSDSGDGGDKGSGDGSGSGDGGSGAGGDIDGDGKPGPGGCPDPKCRRSLGLKRDGCNCKCVKSGYEQNATTKMCEPRCPGGQHWDAKENRCVCDQAGLEPEGVNNACVEKCKEPTSARDKVTKACRCPVTGQVPEGKDRACVAPCDSTLGLKRKTDGSGECECITTGYVREGKGGACVAPCDLLGKSETRISGVCVSKCSSEKHNEPDSKGGCKCSTGYKDDGGGKCKFICPEGLGLITNSANSGCVCSKTGYAQPHTLSGGSYRDAGECQKVCDKGLGLINRDKDSCKCEKEPEYDQLGGATSRCEERCPKSNGLQVPVDNPAGVCVCIDPKKIKNKDNRCVDRCPESLGLDPDSGLDGGPCKCATENYIQPKPGARCIPDCEGGAFGRNKTYNPKSGHCVCKKNDLDQDRDGNCRKNCLSSNFVKNIDDFTCQCDMNLIRNSPGYDSEATYKLSPDGLRCKKACDNLTQREDEGGNCKPRCDISKNLEANYDGGCRCIERDNQLYEPIEGPPNNPRKCKAKCTGSNEKYSKRKGRCVCLKNTEGFTRSGNNCVKRCPKGMSASGPDQPCFCNSGYWFDNKCKQESELSLTERAIVAAVRAGTVGYKRYGGLNLPNPPAAETD